jgi:hypothetical protein
MYTDKQVRVEIKRDMLAFMQRSLAAANAATPRN